MLKSDKAITRNSKKPLSFAFGDRVKIDKTGEEGIIDSIIIDSYSVKYGVNGCAWYDYDDLDFIGRATKKSIKKAFDLLVEEEESYEEESYEEL